MMPNILIANRGEIACRIIRSCRKLGLGTVAVYSEADSSALHVRMADRAVAIGGAAPSASYLNSQTILEAAASSGAHAVHPGYGFLSENAEFAAAVMAAGLQWVGPAPEVIEAMGDKRLARELARKAGVPVLSGGRLFRTGDIEGIADEAMGVGFPLLVKAAYGGGGIGMIRVDALENLTAAVTRAQTLAERAFGDGSVYFEKYLPRARHVEVQLFGLRKDVLILGQRECSIQRRHQKVLEEAPVAIINAVQRAALSEAARKLALQENYENAGTIEFLLSETGAFYFLEMNTRLQVEHPVTEMTTGLDIVELQLKLALHGAESVSLRQEDIRVSGHAVECRLYAEDPERKFLPSPGVLEMFVLPARDRLRIDTGFEQGDRITPFYDPMIAKYVTHGATRLEAIARMHDALSATQVAGLKTNRAFLLELLEHPDYLANAIHTSFAEALAAPAAERGKVAYA